MQPGSFVYVVSSSKEDHFAEMAAISMASLRMTNPGSSIVAVIDKECSQSPGLVEIHRIADKIIEQGAPFSDALTRSRYLKVNLRSYLAGDYIYLDSDTMILRSLADAWNTEGDIAAVSDLSDVFGQPYPFTEEPHYDYDALGWVRQARPYINTGVFLVRDKGVALTFYEHYAAHWETFRKTIGAPNDQPAFNYALLTSGVRFSLLPQTYNAQITMNMLAGRKARVVHILLRTL